MTKEIKELYKETLETHLISGLRSLRKSDITKESYKELVVNINNTINIIVQLENELREDKEAENSELDGE